MQAYRSFRTTSKYPLFPARRGEWTRTVNEKLPTPWSTLLPAGHRLKKGSYIRVDESGQFVDVMEKTIPQQFRSDDPSAPSNQYIYNYVDKMNQRGAEHVDHSLPSLPLDVRDPPFVPPSDIARAIREETRPEKTQFLNQEVWDAMDIPKAIAAQHDRVFNPKFPVREFASSAPTHPFEWLANEPHTHNVEKFIAMMLEPWPEAAPTAAEALAMDPTFIHWAVAAQNIPVTERRPHYRVKGAALGEAVDADSVAVPPGAGRSEAVRFLLSATDHPLKDSAVAAMAARQKPHMQHDFHKQLWADRADGVGTSRVRLRPPLESAAFLDSLEQLLEAVDSENHHAAALRVLTALRNVGNRAAAVRIAKVRRMVDRVGRLREETGERGGSAASGAYAERMAVDMMVQRVRRDAVPADVLAAVAPCGVAPDGTMSTTRLRGGGDRAESGEAAIMAPNGAIVGDVDVLALAERVFAALPRIGIEPDERMWAARLGVWASRQGGLRVYNANVVGRMLDLVTAMTHEANRVPSRACWSYVLAACVRTGNVYGARKIFDNVKALANMEPDVTLYRHAIEAAFIAGQPHVALTMFEEVEHLCKQVPTRAMFVTMIKGLGLAAVRDRGLGLRPADRERMHAMSGELARAARHQKEFYREAGEFLQRMRAYGHEPCGAAYAAAMEGAAVRGDLRRTKALIRELVKCGLTPTASHYESAMRAYANAHSPESVFMRDVIDTKRDTRRLVNGAKRLLLHVASGRAGPHVTVTRRMLDAVAANLATAGMVPECEHFVRVAYPFYGLALSPQGIHQVVRAHASAAGRSAGGRIYNAETLAVADSLRAAVEACGQYPTRGHSMILMRQLVASGEADNLQRALDMISVVETRFGPLSLKEYYGIYKLVLDGHERQTAVKEHALWRAQFAERYGEAAADGVWDSADSWPLREEDVYERGVRAAHDAARTEVAAAIARREVLAESQEVVGLVASGWGAGGSVMATVGVPDSNSLAVAVGTEAADPAVGELHELMVVADRYAADMLRSAEAYAERYGDDGTSPQPAAPAARASRSASAARRDDDFDFELSAPQRPAATSHMPLSPADERRDADDMHSGEWAAPADDFAVLSPAYITVCAVARAHSEPTSTPSAAPPAPAEVVRLAEVAKLAAAAAVSSLSGRRADDPSLPAASDAAAIVPAEPGALVLHTPPAVAATAAAILAAAAADVAITPMPEHAEPFGDPADHPLPLADDVEAIEQPTLLVSSAADYRTRYMDAAAPVSWGGPSVAPVDPVGLRGIGTTGGAHELLDASPSGQPSVDASDDHHLGHVEDDADDDDDVDAIIAAVESVDGSAAEGIFGGPGGASAPASLAGGPLDGFFADVAATRDRSAGEPAAMSGSPTAREERHGGMMGSLMGAGGDTIGSHAPVADHDDPTHDPFAALSAFVADVVGPEEGSNAAAAPPRGTASRLDVGGAPADALDAHLAELLGDTASIAPRHEAHDAAPTGTPPCSLPHQPASLLDEISLFDEPDDDASADSAAVGDALRRPADLNLVADGLTVGGADAVSQVAADDLVRALRTTEDAAWARAIDAAGSAADGIHTGPSAEVYWREFRNVREEARTLHMHKTVALDRAKEQAASGALRPLIDQLKAEWREWGFIPPASMYARPDPVTSAAAAPRPLPMDRKFSRHQMSMKAS